MCLGLSNLFLSNASFLHYFCVRIGIGHLFFCALLIEETFKNSTRLVSSETPPCRWQRHSLIEPVAVFVLLLCDTWPKMLWSSTFSTHWKVLKWKGISLAPPPHGNWQGALRKFTALSPSVRWSLLTSHSVFKYRQKNHQLFDSPVNAVIAC